MAISAAPLPAPPPPAPFHPPRPAHLVEHLPYKRRTCSMRRKTCDNKPPVMQHETYSVQHTTCNTRRSMRQVACSIPATLGIRS